MPKYRVRQGARLSHHGKVVEGGTLVDLPLHVATDPAISGLVEKPDGPKLTVATNYDEATLRPHKDDGVDVSADDAAKAKL